MSVILYADISEKLISSFRIRRIPDQELPSLPSSFLLDLESGNNQRIYTFRIALLIIKIWLRKSAPGTSSSCRLYNNHFKERTLKVTGNYLMYERGA